MRVTKVSGAVMLLLLQACGGSISPSQTTGTNANATTPTINNPPVESRQCKNRNTLRNPYFGDLHVHTTYSLDANTQGTIVKPNDAYRFAQGEKLGIQPYTAQGVALRTTQIVRPLDFAAVTDHAELFGETEICTNPTYTEYNFPECIFYRNSPSNAFTIFNLAAVGLPELPNFPIPPGTPVISGLPVVGDNGSIPRLPYCGVNGERCLEAAKTPWRDIQRAAEANYDRSDQCRFTAFVGYEYTGAPLSNNLHRNVIFRSEVVPELPPAYQEYPHPELLWQALADKCKSADGCDYLTIPHNSNLSAGLMFETKDRKGNDYTTEFARLRQQNEPLAEITQHKGQSECLGTTGPSANDELCGFEILPYNNLTGNRFNGLNTGPPKPGDFLREALKEGLVQEQKLGANPFKYGFIGSSDTHIGTPGNVLENNFPGHGGAGAAARDAVPPGLSDVIEVNPGGLAVLWAEQNTRDSLFAAMRRREAYGTSGTRPIVRFFGGWNLPSDQCGSSDFAQTGYANGVPMGGDLPAKPTSVQKPRFAVSALRDPGANGEPTQPLQRIQIIKGWVENGVKKEQVYEVAGNPKNGAGVDLSTCLPTNADKGFASLCSVWEDPNFNPANSAFYYARVVENPSCRWSTQQCLAAKVDCSNSASVPTEFKDCCNATYPKTIQERAWTSPIWYKPSAP